MGCVLKYWLHQAGLKTRTGRRALRQGAYIAQPIDLPATAIASAGIATIAVYMRWSMLQRSDEGPWPGLVQVLH